MCVAHPHRNFGFHWNEGGSSNGKCAQTYHGPEAFSTPEAQAIADLIKSVKPISYIDFHSYSQLFMEPFGYSCDRDSEKDVSEGARIAVEGIQRIYGTKYKSGGICKTIYKASGNSVDWAAEVGGVKYSYAVELRDSGKYGFLLPADQIIPTGEETLDGVASLWRYIALLES